MEKSFPKTQEKHRHQLVDCLVDFGLNKHGVKRAVTEMLKELELEDTKENRQRLRDRLRNCNPNSPRCDEKFQTAFQKRRKIRISQLKENQDNRRAFRRHIIDNQIDRLIETEELSADERAVHMQLNAYLKNDRDEDEYESKLHGLIPHRTRVSDEGEAHADIGSVADLPPDDQVEKGERSKTTD